MFVGSNFSSRRRRTINTRLKKSNKSKMSHEMSGAISCGDIHEIRSLLRKGENPNARDHQGCTVLHYMASRSDSYLVGWLLEAGADPNARDNDTETVLMWAAAEGRANIVRMLIKAGADVNAITNLDGTALRWAVKSGDNETVRILLDAGANVNAPIVLIQAVYLGYTQIVRWLLELGADVNDTDSEGETALMIVQEKGYNEFAQILKEFGA